MRRRDGTVGEDARRTLLVIGCGYSATALARRLLPEGWAVIGGSRSPERLAALERLGIAPAPWPLGDPEGVLARADSVLISAGPDAEGDPTLRAIGDALAQARGLRWVGYLSTTGVYGDHDGGWVDEETPLNPATERGRARVAAEDAWRALAARAGWPLAVFRLAGIYGPGRGPFEKIRRGTARRIVKPGQVFSRIHVDDIATVLQASLAAPQHVGAFNVCDDDPAPPQDILAFAADLLGAPPPPEVAFADAGLTGMAASFYAESKRVRNHRIKRDLGVTLRYPDYRAGLRAVLEAERRGGDHA
jgi:nucleoside-diphosphate-sugar epimerase